MTDSKAQQLLKLAAAESKRLERHLLVAAALREVLKDEPVVVGGTAEEFWANPDYHETDLDMCAVVSRADQQALERMGFARSGRHWHHSASDVAVEFPGERLEGSYDRTVEIPIGPGSARIIGVDDFYLERLRQATGTASEGVEFHSAMVVMAARYDEIDWDYVTDRLEQIEANDPPLGNLMKAIDSRIRRRVRRELTQPGSSP